MDVFMILLIPYVIGYLWTYRYTVGYILSDTGGQPDGASVFIAVFLGLIFNIVWPVFVVGRVVYVLYVKHGIGETKRIESVFPGPKSVETKAEKNVRLEREAQHMMAERRRQINARERELELPLTKW